MKKIIFVTLILLSAGYVTNAQNITPGQPVVKTDLINPVNFFENGRYNHVPSNEEASDYLLKSRNQKTGAFILMGLGCAAVITGIIIESKNSVDNLYSTIVDESTNNSGAIIAGAGAGLILGSIPLFIASSRNKKKANVSAGSQPTGFGVPANIGKNITGISMTIPLGK